MENSSICFHFHVCYLSCELKGMLPLFCQFLVVRVLERIQNVSNEKRSGCAKNYRFSILHPCVKTSLTERVDMFLPQAKTEVMEKMERLISLLVQRIIVLTSSVLAKRRLARGIQQLYYMAFYALATTYTPDAPPPLTDIGCYIIGPLAKPLISQPKLDKAGVVLEAS